MSDESTFQIVNFGADLLGSYYTARQAQSSILSLPSVQSNVSLSAVYVIRESWVFKSL